MFRKLTVELNKIAQRWSARPLWSASLGALLTILIVGGPLACVVHCLVVSEAHTAHHAAEHAEHHHAHYQPAAAIIASSALDDHALLLVNEHGDHALCDYVMGRSSEATPSALTIGVVMLIGFTLQIAVVSFRPVDLKPQLRLLTLPPPLDPPRSAPGLT